MAKFEKLNPRDVVLGRGRSALTERVPYVEALRGAQAGRITLDPGDTPAKVKRMVRQAASDLGIKVRSSWEDGNERVLLWKRSGRSA